MILHWLPAALALACFLSFGWAMIYRFRRTGGPALWMRITAGLAIPAALLNLWAVCSRDLRCPLTACALYGCSLVLFWSCVRVSNGRLAACGQTHVSCPILREGPYAVVRHPFYASYNLAWMAGFAATLWWPLAIAAFAMGCIYERSAREEERGFLNSGLACEYAEYQRRTGRFLPLLGRAAYRGGFSSR